MKKRMVILTVSLIAVVGIIVGVSYAFFSIGGSQEQANTFTSGCLNISLTDASSSINLTNTYPITDIEGLKGTSYDFTITNTCDTSTNYSINLESLNQVANSLSADYIKVSLSSDTVGNVISILSDNAEVTPEIDNAYEAYNLYTGTLGASETKTYHLKLWIDYDATVEQAANKVYQSKINVIANPETQVVDTLEATFELNDKTLTSNLTNNVTSATYCTTTDNICTPSTSATIANNNYTVDLEPNENNQMVCTRLNGTSKIICSNPLKIQQTLLKDAILANKTISDERSGAITGTLTTNTTGTVYRVADDDGDSYVFAGAPTDNWVSFAGYYWRIIRINGDGSIRMIYNGNSTATTGEGTMINSSQTFNSSYNDNAYVGYMYGSTGASSYASTHTNTNNSSIKTVVDNWYRDHLLQYAQYISTEAGFCGDRKIVSGYSGYETLGYGTNATVYAPTSRFLNTSWSWLGTQNPTLKCSQSNDLYTISGSSKGNHALTYPIGLITADEVILAGGFGGSSNSSYYLYNNAYYWTMSPSFFDAVLSYARMFFVYSDGGLGDDRVSDTYGVRPVINLSADITISSGNGTSETPYIVS